MIHLSCFKGSTNTEITYLLREDKIIATKVGVTWKRLIQPKVDKVVKLTRKVSQVCRILANSAVSSYASWKFFID